MRPRKTEHGLMEKGKKHQTIDEYIKDCPKQVISLLQKIRKTIKEVAPEAEETISYGIPTFRLNGKNLVHFAAFRDHLSFFPTASGVEAFKKELKGYKISRGTIQFPIDKEPPYDLIRKITKFRVDETMNQAKKKN